MLKESVIQGVPTGFYNRKWIFLQIVEGYLSFQFTYWSTVEPSCTCDGLIPDIRCITHNQICWMRLHLRMHQEQGARQGQGKQESFRGAWPSLREKGLQIRHPSPEEGCHDRPGIGCSIRSQTLAVGLTLNLGVLLSARFCLGRCGQMVFLQKQLSNLVRWWNIQNLGQPNPSPRADVTPCILIVQHKT